MENMQKSKKELQEQVSDMCMDIGHQEVVQELEPREILGGRRDIVGVSGKGL